MRSSLAVKRIFVTGFGLAIVAAVVGDLFASSTLALTPRVFWTVVMPLVPIGFVLFGFHTWRKVCPIATVGELGARLHKRGKSAPAFWRRNAMSIGLLILMVTLVFRLVATNGDGIALAVFLVMLGLGAFVFNAKWGGRSFCHYACPVGVVERIYTDAIGPVLPRREDSSRCEPCTGCTKSCVDIDGDRAYERTIEQGDRRRVFYAFPGVVFAFYFYFWLRVGDWEAYFDGRWTAIPLDEHLLFGPGFFFAPQVPALVAATITIFGFAALSWLFFSTAERQLARRWNDSTELRHRMLSLASFTAFNVFYVFAGAPTLRLVPGLSRFVAFAIPIVATIVIARRLVRGKSVTSNGKKKLRLQVIGTSTGSAVAFMGSVK